MKKRKTESDFVRNLKCAKCGATNRDSTLRFHRFPRPGARGCARAHAWAEYAFPNKKWSNKNQLIALHTKHAVLCDDHFDDTSYIDKNRTKLNVYAVPKGAMHIYDRLRSYERLRDSNLWDHDYELGTKDPKLCKVITPVTQMDRPKQSSCMSVPHVAVVEKKELSLEERTSKYLESIDAVVAGEHQVPQNSSMTTLQERFHTDLEPTQMDVDEQPRDTVVAVKQKETSSQPDAPWRESASSTRASESSNICPPSPTPDEFPDSPASVKSETFETSRTEAAEEWYREAAQRVCRVCLRVSDDADEMAPLVLHEALTPLADTMLALAPDIQISPSDFLPKQLCRTCAGEASRAERFLRQARHTQQRLAELAPSAVAEDVFQTSLFSHYFPSDATSLVPHPDVEDALVSLKFDGENLEFEKFEFTPAFAKTVLPKKGVTVSKNDTVELSPLPSDQAVFAEPLYTVSEVTVDCSDGAPSSSLDSFLVFKKSVDVPIIPTVQEQQKLPPPTPPLNDSTEDQPSLRQPTFLPRILRKRRALPLQRKHSGELRRVRAPSDDWHVGVKRGVREGDAVSAHHASMIAKLHVGRPDREAAFARIEAQLAQFEA